MPIHLSTLGTLEHRFGVSHSTSRSTTHNRVLLCDLSSKGGQNIEVSGSSVVGPRGVARKSCCPQMLFSSDLQGPATVASCSGARASGYPERWVLLLLPLLGALLLRRVSRAQADSHTLPTAAEPAAQRAGASLLPGHAADPAPLRASETPRNGARQCAVARPPGVPCPQPQPPLPAADASAARHPKPLGAARALGRDARARAEGTRDAFLSGHCVVRRAAGGGRRRAVGHGGRTLVEVEVDEGATQIPQIAITRYSRSPEGRLDLPRRRLDEIAGMTRVLPGVSLLSPGISAILKYPQYRGEYFSKRKGGAG